MINISNDFETIHCLPCKRVGRWLPHGSSGQTNGVKRLWFPALAGMEISVFPDGRAIIRGTEDPAVARAVYSRYIGV